MGLLVVLIVSVAILVCGVIQFLQSTIKLKKSEKGLKELTLALFCASVVIFLPVYSDMFRLDGGKLVKVILLSIHNTIRLFIVDGEYTIISDFIGQDRGAVDTMYGIVAAVYFVLSPVLTFGFVLSFFKNFNARKKFLLGYSKDVFIFSELNEKTLALAKSLIEGNEKRLIIFNDVYENIGEQNCENIDAARSMGAILFQEDILVSNYSIHSKKASMYFFIAGENESENISHAMQLIPKYRDTENTHLILFSAGVETDVITGHTDKGRMKVRCIDPSRALIENYLYEYGSELFDTADNKHVGVLLMGLGRNGSNMLKSLSWFLQMDGYDSRIDAFDIDEKAESRMRADCPELLDEKINGKYIEDDARYDIRIHSGMDVHGAEFIDCVKEIPDISFIFVSLGNDTENLKAALNMRIQCERMGIHPIIRAIYEGNSLSGYLNEISNFKHQKYDICFMGAVDSMYSEKVVIDSELEEKGLELHSRWDDNAEAFFAYEYNYHSSIAAVIHEKAKNHCIGDDENPVLEHKRWNAYMRSEGYVFGGSTKAEGRNDLGKMHNCLTGYNNLAK